MIRCFRKQWCNISHNNNIQNYCIALVFYSLSNGLKAWLSCFKNQPCFFTKVQNLRKQMRQDIGNYIIFSLFFLKHIFYITPSGASLATAESLSLMTNPQQSKYQRAPLLKILLLVWSRCLCDSNTVLLTSHKQGQR